MNSDEVLDQLKRHFLNSGFNLTLAIKASEYDSAIAGTNKLETIFPNAKSVILVGFGGKRFWTIFQEFLKENPHFKTNNVDLIDSYSVLKFNEASQILESYGISYMTAYPFGKDALSINFLKLGELAGAGVPSLLGILLHPVYGPWISLRGVILTDMEFDHYDKPLVDFSPCPTCDKPCIEACPANTISESGWDYKACINYRISDRTCAHTCASRRACPYGKDEQYSEAQLRYHHEFVLKSVKEYFKKNPNS